MANLNDVDMTTAGELGEGFVAIPPGDYQVYMESSERKTTKNGDGEYLECAIIVATGPHEGAKVFSRLNLWNPSAQAVEIAKSQWRALCEATLGQPFALNNESSSLHNKMFIAEVANVPMNDKNPNSKRTNELVFRKGKIRGMGNNQKLPPQPQNAPASQAAAQPVASAPVQASVGKPPWKK